MTTPALPAGPTFTPPGEVADKAFGDREWTNGVSGSTAATRVEQTNAKGPWQSQFPGRPVVVQPWGARSPQLGAARRAPQNYFNRPSLLRIDALWPVGIVASQAPNVQPPVARPHPTRIHLRQTKLIDHPAGAAVIPTTAPMLINTASQWPAEWIDLADDPAAPATTLCSNYVNAVAPLAPGAACAVPSCGNAMVGMHILVNCANMATLAAAGAAIPAVVYVPNTLVGRQNRNLRMHYYAALEQARIPTPPGAALALAAATVAGAVWPGWPDAFSISFPLIAWQAFGFQRAADQACIALREYFNPTAGSESHAVVGAGAILALETARRSQWADVYLTFPNNNEGAAPSPFNPPPLGVGPFEKNAFGKEMGQQELAWTRAIFTHLRCPSCWRRGQPVGI